MKHDIPEEGKERKERTTIAFPHFFVLHRSRPMLTIGCRLTVRRSSWPPKMANNMLEIRAAVQAMLQQPLHSGGVGWRKIADWNSWRYMVL